MLLHADYYSLSAKSKNRYTEHMHELKGRLLHHEYIMASRMRVYVCVHFNTHMSVLSVACEKPSGFAKFRLIKYFANLS